MKLDGWQTGADGRWHKVLDDVKAGKWSFTQLFVNDQRRFRPRLPKHGYYTIARELPPTEKAGRKWHDRFGYSGDDLRADWANRGDVEVQVFRGWTAMRLRIGSLDPAQRVVTLAGAADGPDDLARLRQGGAIPGRQRARSPRRAGPMVPGPAQRRADLRSHAGRAAGKTCVIAPRLERLLVIEGDLKARRWVEHLRFPGLTFAHSNWAMPARGQACGQSEVNLDGAVSAIGARNLVFDGLRRAARGRVCHGLRGRLPRQPHRELRDGRHGRRRA